MYLFTEQIAIVDLADILASVDILPVAEDAALPVSAVAPCEEEATTSSAITTGASSTPSHHMRVASHPARRTKRKYEDDAFLTLLDREEVKVQLETENLKLQGSILEMKLIYWQHKVSHMNN